MINDRETIAWQEPHLVKVLHLIGGLSEGGAEKQCKLLAEASKAFGIDAVIAHVNPPSCPDCCPSVPLLQLKRDGSMDAVSLIRSIKSAINRSNPDLVHLWLPFSVTVPAAMIARLKRIPVVSSQRHRLGGVGFGSLWIKDLIGGIAHALSNRIVTNYPTEHEPWWFRKCFKARLGVVIPNGVELNRRQASPAPRDNPVVRGVFVGRLTPQKRLDVLLDSIATARARGVDVTLDVYGVGELESQLRSQAERLGIDEAVRFMGYRNNWRDCAAEYRFLVLPSVVEGMPNVLLEAFAAGIPVIATRIPEIVAICTDGHDSLLFPAGSHEALASAIIRIVSDHSLSAELRQNGCITVAEYSVESMASLYVQLYRSIVTR